MSSNALVGLQRAAVARRRMIAAAFVAPVVIAAAFFGPIAGAAALVVAIGVIFWFGRVSIDAVARRVDARVRSLEDSTALLLTDEATLNPVQRLQRERIAARVRAIEPAVVRDDFPAKRVAWVWLVVAAIVLAASVWPRGDARQAATTADREEASEAAATETKITTRRATITPPAYTGLAARTVDGADLKVETGAAVAWKLAFDPPPASAALVFHDGTRVALARNGGDWSGQRTITAATLYRVEIEGGPPLVDQELRRIDVIPDRAPDVRVVAPDKTLTLLTKGQRQWALTFDASDDYGLGAANLSITLAQGSGENIEVSSRNVALQGKGDERSRRYAHTLDLGALGIAEGDDVIVRLSVRDRRAPTPNETRTASFILRWPPERGAESTGVEGLVRDTLPAYFRSQRQIIIDTEALIAKRRELAADAYAAKSDEIGVDQRLLRLRYGQFLGEEAEDAPTGEFGHDDEGPSASGEKMDLLHSFGHAHDDADAATMLDPETKKILRRALAAMWDAEGALRTGQPSAALPHEYRALEAIKEVQQASRIYLARVGLELPPVDAARRLTGDLTGAASARSPLVAAGADAALATTWAALSRGEETDLAALDAWLAEHAGEEAALPVVAALDRVRRDATCVDCRRVLAARLWPLLPAARPTVVPRDRPDAMGKAYLDALE